ncbi:hypothetical protein GCM10010195_71240 [Kitasatospora griseola]|nr:hypothetical protein GCM10010195_71240 [Kitasatospora griseola]
MIVALAPGAGLFTGRVAAGCGAAAAGVGAVALVEFSEAARLWPGVRVTVRFTAAAADMSAGALVGVESLVKAVAAAFFGFAALALLPARAALLLPGSPAGSAGDPGSKGHMVPVSVCAAWLLAVGGVTREPSRGLRGRRCRRRRRRGRSRPATRAWPR